MPEQVSRPEFLLKAKAPVWVLITGNLRSGDEFKRILETVIKHREQKLIDGILFCTWAGELDQAPGLEAVLSQAGVDVLLVDPPKKSPKLNPLFHGYLYHQRRSVHFGLKALPQGAFVIKARTDFAQERYESLMDNLFNARGGVDLRCEIDEPILKTRIFTYDVRPDFLFYWDDIVYCGLREDLLVLDNCDISNEVNFPGHDLPPECRLFAPAFIASYPLIAWFYENIKPDNFAQVLHRWAGSEEKVELPRLVIEILASYFHILSRYVQLPELESDNSSELTLQDFFRSGSHLGIEAFAHPWESHKIHRQKTLTQLRESTLLTGPELIEIDRMMREMDSNPQARARMPEDLPAAIAEIGDFEKAIGIHIFDPQFTYHKSDGMIGGDGGKTVPLNLDAIPMQEKRYPSWLETKKMGAKRLLSEIVLKKLL